MINKAFQKLLSKVLQLKQGLHVVRDTAWQIGHYDNRVASKI